MTQPKAVVDARVRANARLLSAGRLTIDEVTPVDSRVDCYVFAIATYDYKIESVDARYVDQVKAELGIVA